MIPRRSERKWGRKIFGKIYFHERGNNDERRANANFIQRSVWPASPSRVVSNESRHPCKNFSIGRNGGMSGTGALPVPIVIENGAVDRPALPLCLRFTFAERRNFHPLSSDKSWGERYGKSMPRTWRRIRGWGDSTTRSRFTCPRSDAVFNRFSAGNYYLASVHLLSRIAQIVAPRFFKTVWIKLNDSRYFSIVLRIF